MSSDRYARIRGLPGTQRATVLSYHSRQETLEALEWREVEEIQGDGRDLEVRG
jgi:hypothetical protein